PLGRPPAARRSRPARGRPAVGTRADVVAVARRRAVPHRGSAARAVRRPSALPRVDLAGAAPGATLPHRVPRSRRLRAPRRLSGFVVAVARMRARPARGHPQPARRRVAAGAAAGARATPRRRLPRRRARRAAGWPAPRRVGLAPSFARRPARLALPVVHAASAGRDALARCRRAMKPGLLVLGIDAADPLLVERWSADGTMPNLARLMREGLSGRSGGLEGFCVGSTWPSFYTGVSPAGHGHHSLVQLRPGSYDYYEVAAGDVTKAPPFWEHLGAQGRRVAILDVPLTRLSPTINGVQTVEWGSHDALSGFCAHPPEPQHDIARRFGSHPLGSSCDGQRRNADDYREFVSRLTRGAKLKGEITRHVLSLERWDFAMQVFTEAHCAGHQCWHVHDPHHPAHDRAIA